MGAIMENIKIGDVIMVNAISDIPIVVTHIKDEEFQGVYFNNVSQEFKVTPMLPQKNAIKVEQVNE